MSWLSEGVGAVVKAGADVFNATVGGIPSLVSSGIQFLGGQEANKANVEAVREANKGSAELWREQTAYNQPILQMQRLKQAGLNPNLVYGTGTATSMASQAPRLQAAEISNPVPPNMFDLSKYQQIQNARLEAGNLAKQNDLIQAQIEKTNAETGRVKKDTELAEVDRETRRRELDIHKDLGASGFPASKEDSSLIKTPLKVLNSLIRGVDNYFNDRLEKSDREREQKFYKELYGR